MYMHVFPYFIIKGGEVFMFMHISFVLQIGEKEFDVFYACLCMFISLCLHTCLFSFMCFIAISYCLFVMHELRGSFFKVLL